MSRYNLYYYLLFVLLIFGAFASMAQNDYGLKIMGGSALAFGVIFLLQLITYWRYKGVSNWVLMMELPGLIAIAAILSMRVFYIRFPFVEVVFGLAGLMVITSYVIRIARSWTDLYSKSKAMAALVVLFLTGITSYFISLTLVPFIPMVAEPFGVAGFLFLILFAIGGIVKNQILVDGERLSVFSYILKVRDRSIVLASLFILFTAYTGLTKIDFLPKMYSDKFPQKYFELVNLAESGKDKPLKGKFRHEEFKEMYDRFVDRHIGQERK
ncbi:MAG: hypothetical protein MUE95_13130 [Cyclobacteriaceae bacterium]|jgi:hypothetical protein|nr:hypothetical protein [Cyclobacteriaceae bacterium]